MKPAIMIVDDAAFMRRLIKKALINGGYDKIIEAENGKAALELYKSERPGWFFWTLQCRNAQDLRCWTTF